MIRRREERELLAQQARRDAQQARAKAQAERRLTGSRRESHADNLRDSLRQFQEEQRNKSSSSDATLKAVAPGYMRVNGETFKMYDVPRDDIPVTVLWPKPERMNLDPEQKQIFVKFATSDKMFDKNDKMRLPDFTQNEDGTLKGVSHLRSQMKTLKAHLTKYGMCDVFTIMLPVDVSKSAETQEQTFSLFEDYPRLSVSFVANSNQWWRRYVNAPWIAENMEFSYDLLQNNTTPSLWSKALEDYDDFAPNQRGGPLMLYLILARIQNTSETSLDNLRLRLKNLKISEIPGEDVEIVVSMIKSTYSALKGASRPEKSFIPDDLPETIYRIFQTTSVPRFNKTFHDEQERVIVTADKTNTLPVWPKVTEITSLASRSLDHTTA
jgi:hypothetical protein